MKTAYCGLICDSCLIHKATLEQNKALQMKMRSEIAEKCNKLYGTTLQAGDINNCDGCRADSGELFSGCLNCGIRKCAMTRSIENCACCNDYVCDILEKHFLLDPEARKRLEEIRPQI